MQKHSDLSQHDIGVLEFLNDLSDAEMITTEQAARVIGVSLRTMRNWEKDGKTPLREPEGSYPRRYKLCDIRKYAKHRRQQEALLAVGFSPRQVNEIHSMQIEDQKKLFVRYGFDPSLWP